VQIADSVKAIILLGGLVVTAFYLFKAGGLKAVRDAIFHPQAPVVQQLRAWVDPNQPLHLADYNKLPYSLHVAFDADGTPISSAVPPQLDHRGVVVWYSFDVAGIGAFQVHYYVLSTDGRNVSQSDIEQVVATGTQAQLVRHQFFVAPRLAPGERVYVVVTPPNKDSEEQNFAVLPYP
jgi:hypothetical protein